MRKKIKLYTFFISLIMVFLSANVFAEDNSLSGIFEGTGRECSGKLIVNKKTITWDTPFSRCKNVPYRIIAHRQDSKTWHTVYALKTKNKACLFRIIVLDYNVDPRIDWNLQGYLSIDTYKEKNTDYTGCYLSRGNKAGYVIEGFPNSPQKSKR